MAWTISQGVAASYNTVVTKKRPANQWVSNGLLREFERQGFVKKVSFGAQIEATLDKAANNSFGFLSYDLQPTSTQKTDVLSAAIFDVAELSGSMVWSKKDEATNPTENQKVDLIDAIIGNGLDSHDNAIEQGLFATSTNGFLGYGTHIVAAGTGSDGGIDSSIETVWRNQQVTYVDDTDIEVALTSLWNSCTKSSGDSMAPSLLVSDGATQALFEGSQQGQQRYVDTQELKAGFKILGFKTARYVFSQYGGTSIYMSSPKSHELRVSREFFREKSDRIEFDNANGTVVKIYSALQFITTNRSRGGVAHL